MCSSRNISSKYDIVQMLLKKPFSFKSTWPLRVYVRASKPELHTRMKADHSHQRTRISKLKFWRKERIRWEENNVRDPLWILLMFLSAEVLITSMVKYGKCLLIIIFFAGNFYGPPFPLIMYKKSSLYNIYLNLD